LLRRFAVAVVVVMALVVGSTVAQAAPDRAVAPAVALHSCSSGWKHAVIAGQHKCLRAGQFCAKRYESQYRRYGYTCKIASDGRYRLKRL
jgi:hypothetical protein